MARVTTPPIEQARSLFTDLGYAVSDDLETPNAGENRANPRTDVEFRAKRKWREVRVTAVSDATDAPTSGTLRCFVTWRENAPHLRNQLRRADPEYEWAVVGVSEDGEYEVTRAPPGPQALA